jgi:hypothetical protein
VTINLAFERTYVDAARKLPPDRRKAASEALVKFAREPALPSLKFRPLKGLAGHFIISAHRGDRIILRRDGPDSYAAIDVGPHDNVYRRMNRS